MLYLSYNKETNAVQTINYFPFHPEYGLGKDKQELIEKGYLENGMLVESLPEKPQEQIGKMQILYVNPLRWEYEDRPLTQEEKLQQLVDAGAITQEQMNDLLNS